MAKFSGVIGFSMPLVETSPGVWEENVITEKEYYGDIIRNSRRLQTSGYKVNDDINLSQTVSIVADPYASEHFFAMKYVKLMGAAWKITEVEVQYPRLILTIGGIYNGPTAETT